MKPTAEMIEAAAEAIAKRWGPPHDHGRDLSDFDETHQRVMRDDAAAALEAAFKHVRVKRVIKRRMINLGRLYRSSKRVIADTYGPANEEVT